MRAAGARKIRKSVTRREKSGAGSGTRLSVSSLVRHGHLEVLAHDRRPVGGRVGVRVRGHGVPWSAMHVVPAGPTPCARGCMLVCETASANGHACTSVRRALARPKRNLVKVAPGYLRKRVKVASQRDRHKMVKVSEGAENIPPPYALSSSERIGPGRASTDPLSASPRGLGLWRPRVRVHRTTCMI